MTLRQPYAPCRPEAGAHRWQLSGSRLRAARQKGAIGTQSLLLAQALFGVAASSVLQMRQDLLDRGSIQAMIITAALQYSQVSMSGAGR